MKIVENSFIPFKGYKAMTVLCFIFVHHGVKLNEVDINHESIHWEQEKETLIIGFYLLYLILFLWELVRCAFNRKRGSIANSRRNGLWSRAYRSIAFEREAFQHENDLIYRFNRKHYAWIKS